MNKLLILIYNQLKLNKVKKYYRKCSTNSYDSISSQSNNTITTNPFNNPINTFNSSTLTNSFIKLGINTSKYAINLSKLALEGKFDPVIDRNDEINRAIEILSRRNKNNPCFIGESGVGKTALVEELARRICLGDIPEWFKNKTIIGLDLTLMLSGTKFRGEFEERLKNVLKEIEQSNDRIILFIDELHTIAGAGGSEGAIDASNILKPSLARGLIRCIGATTTDEYRKYIEKDAALVRRFQPIYVKEPTIESTIKILEGIKLNYELFHNVIISNEAIISSVRLADKYINDRKFPDKAIDLIDEACSRLRIDFDTISIVIDDEIKQSIDYEESLIHWNIYKSKIKEYFHIKSSLNKLNQEVVQCNYLGNHERIQFIESNEVILLTKQLNELECYINAFSYSKYMKLFNNVITSRRSDTNYELSPIVVYEIDIASIITKQTNIPIDNLLQNEKINLLNMENELMKRIIGQDGAIKAISKCIRLSRAGLRVHERPLGVFLMVGGTGVGKTEVAKALSEYLFKNTTNKSNQLLRLDMSEYMEKFSVSRLIGAPPGYVGYEEGGTLTESVRRRPYQVILLDEFEKAHKDISNLLLQVFDDGRLTDSKGKLVDFKNTIILMTSNIITKEYIDKNINTTDSMTKSLEIRKLLSNYFSPEFVNRLDDIIVFNSLNDEHIKQICRIQLNQIINVLTNKNIDVTFDYNRIYEWLIRFHSKDMMYGARPIKRLIQSKILDVLATMILEDKIVKGDKIHLTIDSDGTDESALSIVINK